MRSPNLRCFKLSLVIVFLFMVAPIVFADSASAATSRVAQIEQVEGEVDVRKAGGTKSFTAYRHMHLNEGDHLSTGPNSYVILKVLDVEDEVFIGENSKLYIGDLQEQSSKKSSKIKMWFGSLWAKANPFNNQDSELEIETPTAVMGVRGTHFHLAVDPTTGLVTMFVSSGAVNSWTRGDGDDPEDGRIILPSQQITVYPGLGGESTDPESMVTYIDVDEFVNKINPDVIEAILRNKQEIDRENEEWLEHIRDNPDSGSPIEDFSDHDAWERYRNNLDHLIDVILSNAIKARKIDQDQLEDIIKRIEEEMNQRIDVDLDKDSLDLTERQRREMERLERMNQQRQEQMEKERQKREEQARNNQDLLNRLKEQKRLQEERNLQEAEERARQAQERHLNNMDDEQKKLLEERMRQREEQRQNEDRSQPVERPNRPVYSGGSGSNGGDADPDPEDDEGSEDTPVNNPPVPVSDPDQSITINERLTITADKLATDEDGDELSFVQARSADEAIVSVQWEGNQLHLDSHGVGSVEVTVEITDGTDTVEVTFVVSVEAAIPVNHAPEAKELLAVSIPSGQSVTWSPSDLAEDADGDELHFVEDSAGSSNADIVEANLDGGVLYLHANHQGSAGVTVEITDGMETVTVVVPVTVIAAETSIYGKVIAPKPAPAGGIPLSVYATDDSFDPGNDRALVSQIVLPEGKTEVFYYMEVPEERLHETFFISYEMNESVSITEKYVRKGIFGEEQQGYYFPSPVSFDGQHENIDLHLIQGNVVSGSVTIPQNAPFGGEKILVIFEDEYGSPSDLYVTKTIPEGESSIPYQLVVPDGSYILSFGYHTGPEGEVPYLDYENGFYYVDVERMIQDIEAESGESVDRSELPQSWQSGHAALDFEARWQATLLDLHNEDLTGADLNFPAEIPEKYEVITKNDMILLMIDPENEKNYSEYAFYIDDEFSELSPYKEFVFVETGPNQTHEVRFKGMVTLPPIIEGHALITDIKDTITTSSEPEITGVEITESNGTRLLSWDSVQGADHHYRVYVYKYGDKIETQFIEPVFNLIQPGQQGKTSIMLDELEDGPYVIRIETWNELAILAGKTILYQ